jgi:transposase
MRTGWYREVHVKSHASQKIRVLLHNRRCLLQKRLDIDAQIRGTIRVFGLKVGKVKMSGYEARIRELIGTDAELQAYIFPMLEARHELRLQTVRLHKLILERVKNDELCRRLMTIPGVGPLTSLAYKTFVDRPQRFRRSRSVGAAVGLTPKKYQSGDKDLDGHVTKCGDEFMRSHLYEAANMLLRRYSKPCALKAWGLRLEKRSSKKIACVAVARRLAVIMHAMWRDGTEFRHDQPGKELDAQAA